jgi:hypothetical protein
MSRARVLVIGLALLGFWVLGASDAAAGNACEKVPGTYQSTVGTDKECKRRHAIEDAEAEARDEFLDLCEDEVTDAECEERCDARADSSGINWYFNGNLCVYDSSETTTTTKVGDKVCGMWPFRTKKKKATHTLRGYCGCQCTYN